MVHRLRSVDMVALGVIFPIFSLAFPTVPATNADRIASLPGLQRPEEELGTQFAGYVSIYGEANPRPQSATADEELFYWFVGRKGCDYKTEPTILWSNGGPGSSSFWGFFIENGPYTISGDSSHASLKPRAHAWSNFANYLIFEHPLNVTLSFQRSDTSLPRNVRTGVRHLYQALLNFVARHPSVSVNPLVLAGESYGGTYIPLLTNEILEGRKKGVGHMLDLVAIVLCSPWVHPRIQMATVTEYATKHGLITDAQKHALDRKFRNNLPAMKEAVQNVSGLYLMNIAQAGDPSFDPVLSYLNRDDVRIAIHAKRGKNIVESSSAMIYSLYQSCLYDSVLGVIDSVLRQQVRIVAVSGLDDASDVNFIGTGRWLQLLNAPGAHNFRRSAPEPWGVRNEARVLGYVQGDCGHHLSWVKLLNAGHLNPMDQPLLIDLLVNLTGLGSPQRDELLV